MSLSDRFLYCIPRGGLNDVLVQIYKCLMYAKHSKRKLVIDTRQCFLNDNLCNYIDIQDPCIYKGALNEWYTLTKNSSVYPPELKECIENIPAEYVSSTSFKANNILCSTDLSKMYSEDIVIYVNCGGGQGIRILRLSVIHPSILKEFRKRHALMPKPYNAFHVRNTDYKSDVPAFLEKHRVTLESKPFFFASDDADTIQLFQSTFEKTMYTFSDIPKNIGKNIHSNHPTQSNYDFNMNAFCDLFMLACADMYNYSCSSSGYSKLACDLHNDSITRNKLLRV